MASTSADASAGGGAAAAQTSPTRREGSSAGDAAAFASDMMRQFPQLTVLRQTQQLQYIQTLIRDKNTSMADFVFFADRLNRVLVEEGLSYVPMQRKDVVTPTGERFVGLASAAPICGVSIMRAGESMESALRDTCRGIKIGKILIQRNEQTAEPDERYSYAKLPRDIAERWVFLLDPMLATGGSACRAIETLTRNFSVPEERIIFLNVVSCPEGLTNLTTRFPRLRIVSAAVDPQLNEVKYILPGLGDFGDRYFSG